MHRAAAAARGTRGGGDGRGGRPAVAGLATRGAAGLAATAAATAAAAAAAVRSGRQDVARREVLQGGQQVVQPVALSAATWARWRSKQCAQMSRQSG